MDEGHALTDEKLKALEKKISREYRKAAKEVEEKLKKYLADFEKADKAKLAELANGIITNDEYKKWRASKILTGKRWRDMRDVLVQDLVNTDKIAAAFINDALPDIFALNANYGTYEIESGLRINTSFTLYNHDTVKRLMRDNPEIIPRVNPSIAKDKRWNRQKITSAVTQGVLQGDSIPNIAKRLRMVTDMDEKAAIRNARTYTTAAENGGRVDSYQRAVSMGIEMEQEWQATLDGRTRNSHRLLDGERIPVGEDEEFSNGCRYPGDPECDDPAEIYNCRCRVIAHLKEFEYENYDRFSRLPANISYDDWKSGQYHTDKNNREIGHGS